MNERLFLALDGDDIGRRLELHMVTEDAEGLGEFAVAFEAVLRQLLGALAEFPASEILLHGGDSLLLAIPKSGLGHVIHLVREATSETGFTFSGGYGETMREAYLALKLAKATGKNKIVPLDSLSRQ